MPGRVSTDHRRKTMSDPHHISTRRLPFFIRSTLASSHPLLPVIILIKASDEISDTQCFGTMTPLCSAPRYPAVAFPLYRLTTLIAPQPAHFMSQCLARAARFGSVADSSNQNGRAGPTTGEYRSARDITGEESGVYNSEPLGFSSRDGCKLLLSAPNHE